MKKSLIAVLLLLLPQLAGATAGAVFACDDFTDTPTIALESHTPTTYTGCSVAGFTWSGATNAMQISTTKQVSPVSSGRGWYHQTGGTAPDDASYIVQADFTTSGAGKVGPGIGTRWLTTGNADTGYFVRHEANAWALYRADGGNTQTALCTNFSDTNTPSGTTIKLSATGTGATVTILVQKNGVDIIGGTQSSCTDSSASRITITGAPAVIEYFPDTVLSAQYLANFKATNAGATAAASVFAPKFYFVQALVFLIKGKLTIL